MVHKFTMNSVLSKSCRWIDESLTNSCQIGNGYTLRTTTKAKIHRIERTDAFDRRSIPRCDRLSALSVYSDHSVGTSTMSELKGERDSASVLLCCHDHDVLHVAALNTPSYMHSQSPSRSPRATPSAR
jgi:hypothetical protein